MVTNETNLADIRQETHFYQKSVLKVSNSFILKWVSVISLKVVHAMRGSPVCTHIHIVQSANAVFKTKKQPKLYSADNGMDPRPVSPELLELTQVEEMLISSVMPIVSLYHLSHGQFGYSGHIINLPQDVATFVKTLPRSPSQLDVLLDIGKVLLGHTKTLGYVGLR